MTDVSARILLLEQKLDVITKEFSDVVQEMQVTVTGSIRLTKIALQSISERLEALERLAPKPETQRTDEEGKEI